MARIYRERVDLDPAQVRTFFEQRGANISDAHPLTSVLYQDSNPTLAEARDAFEKQRILPLLNLGRDSEVLDVGCGIGRWADALVGRVARYHGIDFSAALIAAARERIHQSSFTFQQLSAENVHRDMLDVPAGFSHVIIAGVLLYLNEDQLQAALDAVGTCCAASARIYLREPVATSERLTLKQFQSDELRAEYNAIYRTEGELLSQMLASLEPRGFALAVNAPLYPDHLNNRIETQQRIFIFRSQ
jgi:cyclopropane fatty-acyl-phospholipid synthase-like methyltransferase